MRYLLSLSLLLCVWVSPSNTSSCIAQEKPSKKLYLIQKIHIGDMGNSDEAARFRLLIDDALSKKGFKVVEKAEEADATLKGILSFQAVQGSTTALASVQLKSTDGERLWSGNFQKRFWHQNADTKDSIKARADELADVLRNDWKKSAKAAGIKIDK